MVSLEDFVLFCAAAEAANITAIPTMIPIALFHLGITPSHYKN